MFKTILQITVTYSGPVAWWEQEWRKNTAEKCSYEDSVRVGGETKEESKVHSK